MADDAQTPPPDKQLVQWLRALADAVESDPDLATRVTQGMAAPPEHSVAPEPPAIAQEITPTISAATATPPAVAPPTDAPPPVEAIAPTLRHTRKSSRFGPSVTGRPAELGTGVPDPFAVFARDGEEGLRRALEALRVGTLRAIIRAHDLDPAGKVGASATEKRLVTAIIAAVKRGTAHPAKPSPAKTPRQRSRPTPPVIH